jgi:hypothetical protein
MATGRIINLVWPQRGDYLIETYLPHSTEKDILNGAIVPRNRTPFSATPSVLKNAPAVTGQSVARSRLIVTDPVLMPTGLISGLPIIRPESCM